MMWFMWLAVAGAQPEIPYDGIDQDGDGADWVDVDGDGEPSVLAGGTDCSDRDPAVHSLAYDWPGDGLDQDCDGKDGFVEGVLWGSVRWSAANLSAFWSGCTIETGHSGGPHGERHPHQSRQEVGRGAG